MNSIAQELNSILEGSQAGFLLSDFGKRIFFPRGIVAQSAEASSKAHKHNATAGMAFDEGKPILLDSIESTIFGIEPQKYITYSPTGGKKEIREMWLEQIIGKNPTLIGKYISKPIVVPGLTSGISYTADLFIDQGDSIVIPDYHWDNYDLIFEVRNKANIKTFSFFNGDKINVNGLKNALLESQKNNKVALLLNFPNNPTGYSPTLEEATAIADAINDVANTGVKVLVICDDAYFGLFYEDNIYKESIFSLLADINENVLAVKVDGSTKEDYVWGLRIGFITLGGKGLKEEHMNALDQKLLGIIRSSCSSSSSLSQELIIKALQSRNLDREKNNYETIMKNRYLKVKSILQTRTKGKNLKELPFNSGYFMTFETPKGFNERLRKALLEVGVGGIALGDTSFRIAFSSVDLKYLDDLFNTIFQVSDSLL